MKTNELLNLLHDKSTYKINTLESRSNLNYKDISTYNINGWWNFKYYENLEDRIESFADIKYEKEINEEILVPSNIEVFGYGRPQYVNTQYPWDSIEDVKNGDVPQNNSCAQYTKSIHVSKKSDKKYILKFDGVKTAYNVWVNNKYIGYSEDSYTATEFDISEELVDGDNYIAVEIYRYCVGSWFEDQDCWRLLGIFRDVTISELPIDMFMDMDINIVIPDNLNTASINIKLDNSKVSKLELYKGQSLIYSEEFRGQVSFQLKNPVLWNYECPELYDLKLEQCGVSVRQKIALRKVEIDAGKILLNKKKMVFRGVNRHEFNNITGNVLTKKQIFDELKQIKELNFNAIRCAHYPNDMYTYEVCDELGLMVMNEANIETHGSWFDSQGEYLDQEPLPGNNMEYYSLVLDRVMTMYEQTKNYFSIVSLSLGNESKGGKVFSLVADELRAKCDSRFIHYEGLCWDRTFEDSSDAESQMYTSADEIEKYLVDDTKEKPFLLCEYSHAMGNSNGNMERYVELEKYDKYHGGFIWEYKDHTFNINNKDNIGGDFNDRPNDFNFVIDGLVRSDGSLTPKSKHVKYLFQPLDISLCENKLKIKSKKNYCAHWCDVVLEIINSENNSLKINHNFEIEAESEKVIDITKYKDYKMMNVYINGDESRKAFKLKSNISVNECEIKDYEIIEGRYSVSVNVANKRYMFSKSSGTLVSIFANGFEYLPNSRNILKPNFHRPLTDNDKGAKRGIETADLFAASYLSGMSSFEIVREPIPEIHVEFTNIFDINTKIIYSFNTDGSLNVELIYVGNTKNEVPLSAFGLYLPISSEFSTIHYTGFGPHENYVDRNSSCVYGNFKYEPTVEVNNYVIPQEYGNRTNVDKLSLRNLDGRNIVFSSDEYFEFSIKNEKNEVIEAMEKRSVIIDENKHLYLNKFQTGVGGDDSWGKWVHNDFKFILENELSFKFKLDPK